MHPNRYVGIAVAVLSVLFVSGVVGGVAAAADTPNIVFILADDMSYDSVSYLNSKIGKSKHLRLIV